MKLHCQSFFFDQTGRFNGQRLGGTMNPVGRASAWRGEVTPRRDEDRCPPDSVHREFQNMVGTEADPTSTAGAWAEPRTSESLNPEPLNL